MWYNKQIIKNKVGGIKMYLMYVDESGNTGTDYDNKEQPIFALVGVVIKDKKWHEVNEKCMKK